MSERGEMIGQLIALAVFFAWLIAGSFVVITPPPPQVQQVFVAVAGPTPWISPLLWPGLAPIVGAAVAGGAAWWIAERYTRRLKQIEATLEFSKRFHELIQQQRALNAKYEETLAKSSEAKTEATTKELARTLKIAKDDAKAWWWRFFDLLLYEYDFYQKRMVRERRFQEWMIWRWHDFNPDAGKEWTTCEINYKTGFENWKGHPVHGDRLIRLLEEIHKIQIPPDRAVNEDDRNKFVEETVIEKLRPHAPRRWPRWWWRDDLERGRF